MCMHEVVEASVPEGENTESLPPPNMPSGAPEPDGLETSNETDTPSTGAAAADPNQGSRGARPKLNVVVVAIANGPSSAAAHPTADQPRQKNSHLHHRKKNRHLSLQNCCSPSNGGKRGAAAGASGCLQPKQLPPTPDSILSVVVREEVNGGRRRAEDDRPPPPLERSRSLSACSNYALHPGHANGNNSGGDLEPQPLAPLVKFRSMTMKQRLNGDSCNEIFDVDSDCDPFPLGPPPPIPSKTKTLKKRLSGIFLKGRRRNNSLSNIKSSPMIWRALPDPPKMDTTESSREVTEKKDKYKKYLILSENMRQLANCGWYWGPMTWEHAQTRLTNMPDGSFLVRDSSDDRYIFSLSFRAQGTTHHTRIEHCQGKFSFWSQPKYYGNNSIVEFIEGSMKDSANGHCLYFLRSRLPGGPPYPVKLLHPVSRFSRLSSLQHMCRFLLRRMVRIDLVPQLPVPRRIQDYLLEGQYYYTLDDINQLTQSTGSDKGSSE